MESDKDTLSRLDKVLKKVSRHHWDGELDEAEKLLQDFIESELINSGSNADKHRALLRDIRNLHSEWSKDDWHHLYMSNDFYHFLMNSLKDSYFDC